MYPASPLVIHEILPTEMLAVIFEEHAKLEWRAPAIDARVCRIWRQIVHNTPRAWAYLEIGKYIPPTVEKLRSWLDQSGTAPLHIRARSNFMIDEGINRQKLYDVLSDYHTRIASLRVRTGELSFFEGRDFPYMRLLDVRRWSFSGPSFPLVGWGSMPRLQSLCLGPTEWPVEPLDGLPPLKFLALDGTNCTSLTLHSKSLTTLILEDIPLGHVISGPVSFPSLIYLSLDEVTGLKPHIKAPRLVTYHEGWSTIRELFSAPVHSLVEYGIFGVFGLSFDESDFVKWHHSFPHISRVAIRAPECDVIAFLRGLANHPRSLPVLQMISVRATDAFSTIEHRETMDSLVRVRSDACNMDVALYFETQRPFRIPLWFEEVIP